MHSKLHQLESTGGYTFHGSPVGNIKILEPRQAQTIKEGTSSMVNDGNPAVVTSPFVDIAIFRALFNKTNIKNNYKSSFSCKDDKLFFSTNKESLQQAKDCGGYVYVFNKDDFYKYSSMEYRCENPVKPIEVIQVTFADFPHSERIEITV